MTAVLVTGATGFTGGHLARRLKSSGRAVRVFVRSAADTQRLAAEGFDVAQGNLTSPEAVDRAVQGCETVFHVAALYRSDRLPDQAFFDVNVGGTRNVLDAAQRHGVRRVVHISTGGVHGRIVHPPANEEAPVNPRDPYQQSKLEGERLARSYFANGLAGSVVRPTGIYGPGDTRFLKLFRTVARRQFMMLGAGTALYHMTYIDDLVDGILLCAERPQAAGETFLIGGPEVVTITELVNRIADALGVPRPRRHLPLWPFQLAAPVCQAVCRAVGVQPPLYPRRLEFFTDNRAFDISKARRLLSYEPRVSLDEGIRRTVEWYREHRVL